MFSFFKKDKSPEISTKDKVWKTGAGALQGLLMMAMMRLQRQQSALIVVFFEDEKEKLASFMNENQIYFKELSEASSTGDINMPGIFLVGAQSVNSSVVSHLLAKSAGQAGGLAYFPSHYPLTAHEDKTLTQLMSLGYINFNFCLSFDDPTLKLFGSENILPLLEKLGLDEHEAIEHDMVTRSIKNARKKLDEKVKLEIKATSPEEWFARNIKH